jgi:hypothetical protein
MRKDMEAKLVARFPMMKDKALTWCVATYVGNLCVRVTLCEPKIEKVEDEVFFEYTEEKYDKKIMISKKKFSDILGIKGNVVDIETRYRIAPNKYARATDDDAHFDADNIYYFIRVDEPDFVWIKDE